MRSIAPWFCLGVWSLAVSGGAASTDYLSPADLKPVHAGRQLLVAEHTGKRLDVFDPAQNKVTRSISLEQKPTGIACAADGTRCYVTGGNGMGTVDVIDLASGQNLKTIPVGHNPTAPVLSPDGKMLYVCNRFDHAVGVVDLKKMAQVKVVPVGREPIAAALTPDGRFLYVANHLPQGRADVKYVAAEVSVIDTTTAKGATTIKLQNGAVGLRGVCVSPDGKFVYVTHLLARFWVPTTQVERGWVYTSALSVISVADQRLCFTVLLDDIDLGFANPWAVCVSPSANWLCVSSAGNNEIRMIDLPGLMKKIETETAKPGSPVDATELDMYNDLSFISKVSCRVGLRGIGPRAMAAVGNTLYLAEYFTDSLGKVSLDPEGKVQQIASIPLGPGAPLTPERQGEIFFNDASRCFQKWLSCASCHSDDGRMDGLNWDLMNDGAGNPKNVKSLLFAFETPPSMWLGVRDNAKTAVRAGIQHIEFAVWPEKDAEAVDAFLKSLEPVPSPRLVKGKLSAAAERGRRIFEKAECINCHPSPLFTNLKQYDVGTGTGAERGSKFDVPSLREAWRTAPYLHDGSAATIREVINLNKLGKTRDLTEQEIRDLVEYVESL